MKKMKKVLCLLLTFMMVFAAVGCSSSTEKEKEASGDTIVVTDHSGNEVTITADVQRIVVCDILPLPSVLTIFFDSAEKIVGMAPGSMSAAQNSLISELYPEILNAKTDFIDGSTVNMEELTLLKPDVVIYNAASPELGEQLRNAGFAAVAVSVNKWEYNAIETLNQWIDLISQIFPENDKTQKVREYSEKSYELVQERVKDLPEEERERVFFLFQYTDTNISTSGNSFFGQWWADAVGAINVGEELDNDNSTSVNMEQIYTWNPDKIFITNFNTATPEDLYNNTMGSYDWSGIKAVQEQKAYKMPLGMYRSYTPGVDTPVTLLWFAKVTYPELFEDIDITQEVKSYYQDVFGITLTDEQVEKIFAPLTEAGEVFLK